MYPSNSQSHDFTVLINPPLGCAFAAPFDKGGRQTRKRLAGGFLLLVLLFGLSGCATLRSGFETLDMGTPKPLPPLPPAHELLGKLDARRQSLTSLRGLARIVYKDTQEKGTAKQAIAVSAPDRFRWELFSPVGVAALVTSDGTKLATYFPSEKVLYRGAATPINVLRFTRVLLSPREIVGLLLGAPILPPATDACTVEYATDNDWYRLHCPASGQASVTLWFDQSIWQLRRVEMQTVDGTVSKRIDMADYRAVGEQTFPFEIVLFDLQGQQQASIFYERVELNPNPPDSIFTLAAINGVREVDVDASAP